MDSPPTYKERDSLLDPLYEPEPSQETGPGSHFTRDSKSTSVKTSVHSKSPRISVYPTPPQSASPTQSSFHHTNPFSPSHRHSSSQGHNSPGSSRRSLDAPVDKGKGRERGSSLGERFPGDMSHRPLAQIRKEAKVANRAPHLRKKHIPGADSIDSLDDSPLGIAYHHGGPYDATLLARNMDPKNSPVEAVRASNEEALRATPRENIRDALDRHVPLQGTAVIPPGMAGVDGIPMQYEEGADLMREEDAPGGAYRRWAGVKYHPEDYKGKGEPSFTIERQLKEHKHGPQRLLMPDGSSAYEMQRPHGSRQRSVSGSHAEGSSSGLQRPGSLAQYMPSEAVGLQRSKSTGRKSSGGLLKKLDGLRKLKGKSASN